MVSTVLGTAQFMGRYGRFRESGETPHVELLRAAASSGFSALDTADSYGHAETIIGQSSWPGQLHSKVRSDMLSEEFLVGKLAVLGRSQIDVLYFHDVEVLSRPKSFFSESRERVVRDKAAKLGVSVYTPNEFELALTIPELEVIQLPLSLVDRRISDSLMQDAARAGKELYARSIYLQGALRRSAPELLGRFEALRPTVSRLQELSRDFGISVGKMLAGWVKDRPCLAGIVVGAETPRQVYELSEELRGEPLPAPLLEELRALFVDDPDLLDPRRW